MALFSLPEWSVLILIALATTLALAYVLARNATATRPPSLPRSVRLRTLAILIALVALLLGWEREGGRSWRLKEDYRKKAAANGTLARHWESYANDELAWIRRIEDAAQEGQDLGLVAGSVLVGAYGTDVGSMKAAIQRRIDSVNALRAYHRSLAVKYTLAVHNPRQPVEPDPPPPLPPTIRPL